MHDALPLRQCTARLPLVAKTPGSPCALAGMGRCSAPCTTTDGPDRSYATVASAASEALRGDPSPVVGALAARVGRLAAEERFEEAGQVTGRLRAFVQGADRAQRLDPLARCAELVAARATASGGWEIVVVRHARLAATAVTRHGEDPLPVIEALRATAEVVEAPVAPAPACHPEEAALVIGWLEQPGVRLVHVSDPWSCPVRSAAGHADLAGVSGEVRARVATMTAC
jgi:DNA polymerase-3 subunit epsilon